MRIITGSAKGQKLKTPKGSAVRPTADRVKESLFNILAGRVEGAQVADLFAGTGNLGLEALSRGAAAAVFVDSSPVSLNLVRENAALTRLESRAEFWRLDAAVAVGRLSEAGRRFDLVFCDPPYNRGLVAAVLRTIDSTPFLAAGGLVVLEHSQHEPVPDDLATLSIIRTQRYGETLVSFLADNK
jgi:16S rRNA (guanine966-N2)-methyltransferase